MKRQSTVNRCVAVLFSVGILAATFAARADDIVYSNTNTDLSIRFNPGANEVGDEIVLGGTARYITSFTYQYFAENLSGDENVRLRFYANDGAASPAGPLKPSTLLFDSGWYNFGALGNTARSTLIYGVSDFGVGGLLMPDSFTWSVQFQNVTGGESAGLDIYSPPTTGGNYNEYWDNTGTDWEYRGTNGVTLSFGAQATAVPEPTIFAVGLVGGLAALVLRNRFKRA